MYKVYRRGELQKSSLFKSKMDKELQVIDFSSDYEGITKSISSGGRRKHILLVEQGHINVGV